MSDSEEIISSGDPATPLETQTTESPFPKAPLDALPGKVGEYIDAVAKAFCVDPSMPMTFVIGVASAAVGRAANIRLDTDWREIAPLWLCSIAPPGALKSPVLREVVQPMFLHDRDLGQKHIGQLKENVDALVCNSNAERPRRKQAVVSDVTIEGLVPVLEVSPRVLAYHDELGAMFDAMGCYKRNGGQDGQFYLSLYGGSRLTVNRKGEPDPQIVEDPRLGIVGATTPAKVAKMFRGYEGDGTVERFYLTGVEPRVRKWPKPAIPEALRTEWREKVLSLCALDTAQPRIVTLSPEAGKIFGAFYLDTKPELASGFMQGVISKHCGNVGRIALMLALLDDPNATQVAATQMRAAIHIGEWLLAHSYQQRRRMLNTFDNVLLSNRGTALLNWIERHGGITTASEVIAGHLKDIRSADDVRAVFDELEALGLGYRQPRKTTAGRTATEFVLSRKVSQYPKPALEAGISN